MLRSVFPDDNGVNMNCDCKLMDMQATFRYTQGDLVLLLKFLICSKVMKGARTIYFFLVDNRWTDGQDQSLYRSCMTDVFALFLCF